MNNIYVFEEGQLDTFDVVCPNCGNVVLEKPEYTGGSANLSTKCPACSKWLTEFAAVVIPPETRDEYTKSQIERVLLEYWREPQHDDSRKKEFLKKADEFELHQYEPELDGEDAENPMLY